MQRFTAGRDTGTADELWITEHPPVYTVGVAGRSQHLPRFDNGIPVVRTDRGGQITYHGPGQAVIYTLLDLRRHDLTVRTLVRL
ncbi:lipoyl(octanoyl) transferase LipB, partial [Escherichia coli]|uniref:lipoyl(octanoyl) transferase LipB n=1 Tax=Escherichia coli TaxID=562 RepID=UPI002118CB5E